MMKRMLELLRGKPRLIVFQFGKPMTEAEMADAAGMITTHEEWWRLLLQLVNDQMATLTVQASDPKQSDAETKYYLGGQQALSDLIAELRGRIAAERLKARQELKKG